MTKVHVKATLITEMLGTASADPEIYSNFIGSKAPDALKKEEEVAKIGAEEYVEKTMTIFPKDENGVPFLWDYQIRGFFKDSCSALSRCKGEEISKQSCNMKAFKKVIDGCIFVEPRRIPINLNGGEIGNCQRPLRASTAQGDRIALANSETVPEGSTFEFDVVCLSKEHVPAVIEWLDYGIFKGLLQWRNSGKGRFEYTYTVE